MCTQHESIMRLFASLFVLSRFVIANNDGGVHFSKGKTLFVENVRHEGCEYFAGLKSNDRSIFFTEAFGRLGNNLLVYGLMLQMRISLNVDTYINDECRAYLEKFFLPESILVDSIQRKFCNYDKLPYELYYKDINDVLTDKSYRNGRVIYLFPNMYRNAGQYDGYSTYSHIPTDIHERLLRSMARTVRKSLKFRPEIVSRVTEIFDDVAKQLDAKKKDITFIGVHNRRTDHLEYLKQKGGHKPLKAKYFKEKMDEYREDYDNVVFMYVSDDMEWGMKKLGNEENIFFVGSGDGEDELSIGVDLAIMANCNHTIVSRGTYSLWGSYLAGGERKTELGYDVPEELTDPDYVHEEFIL